MKAVVYDKYGPPEVLQIRDIKKPVPKDHEVLIKIKATTVTIGDTRMRSFNVPPSLWLPSRLILGITAPIRKILGMEVSGIIESTGKKVTYFKADDNVIASTFPGLKFGGYAEYITLSENSLIEIMPSGLSFEEAAPIASGGLAAFSFLETAAPIKKGEKVLINGASGALGTYSVQIAKYYEAEVTAVCSASNFPLVKSLGADFAIDYTKENFTECGKKFDIIFDTVGNTSKKRCKNILAENSRFISCFKNHKTPDKKNLTYIKELIESGKVKAVIDRVYSLEQIQEAHAYVEKGHKKGNVVIRV